MVVTKEAANVATGAVQIELLVAIGALQIGRLVATGTRVPVLRATRALCLNKELHADHVHVSAGAHELGSVVAGCNSGWHHD